MGIIIVNRGYIDVYMWVVQINSDYVLNIEIIDCQKVNNKRVCKQYYFKYFYVILLEIIYMMLLLFWNLYNFNFYGDVRGDVYVMVGGCYGGFNVFIVFIGISEKNFYMILKEFFGEIGYFVYKEVEESVVGVLDYYYNV